MRKLKEARNQEAMKFLPLAWETGYLESNLPILLNNCFFKRQMPYPFGVSVVFTNKSM